MMMYFEWNQKTIGALGKRIKSKVKKYIRLFGPQEKGPQVKFKVT